MPAIGDSLSNRIAWQIRGWVFRSWRQLIGCPVLNLETLVGCWLVSEAGMGLGRAELTECRFRAAHLRRCALEEKRSFGVSGVARDVMFAVAGRL